MVGTFRRFSEAVAHAAGTPWTFLGACALILAWAVVGFIIGFTDTVQLVINTTTTIITFLMAFIIQGTQNTDSKAVHLKLDEIVVSLVAASNRVIDAENMSDEEVELLWQRINERRNGGGGHGPSGAVPPEEQ